MTAKSDLKSDIVTFGCRLNAFESQIMRDNLAAADDENTIVFNT